MNKKMNKEEMLELVDKSLAGIKEGEIIEGEIVKIDKRGVVIDTGLKSEGIIPISEFENAKELKVGDKVEVLLENMEGEDGAPEISRQKAALTKIWNKIEDSYKTGSAIEGRVSKLVKGGLIINVSGVEAFLPGSQLDIRPLQKQEMKELLGQNIRCNVIKVDRMRNNIVFSRKSLMEVEMEEKKEKLFSKIEVGSVIDGVVKNITDFGVFVELDGVDALVHIGDITWGRVSHPSEVLAVGDKVKTKILEIDEDKQRITLGMKQLVPCPWEGVEERYPIGSKIKGKVVSITGYGAFVEVEKGIEGLIHISEMSWIQRMNHPSQILTIGDTVEATVLSIDKDHEKMSLSLKQTMPNPWDEVDKKYPVGSTVMGRVRAFTDFGAFISLEDGIDGLIHLRNFSWARRIDHPSDVLKRGEQVECKVLEIDSRNHRISLGLKQMSKDPLDELKESCMDKTMKGKIAEIVDKGIVVNIKQGSMNFTAFVPFSHLAKAPKEISDEYEKDDVLELKLLEIDTEKRRIIMSEKEN